MTTSVPGTDAATTGIVGFNHVAMPVRDVHEALRFWSTIFGAQVLGTFENDGFGIVAMPGNFLLGFSAQDKGAATGRRAEYPHYGLDVAPDRMDALRDRLTEFGVPCDQVWTRFRSEALMYFRDPSGNLFELYCHEGYSDVGSIDLGRFYGGDFETDLEALNYDTWNDPGR
ncbi:hypothetical protein GCM10009613_49710 [Pseudonocardia kongjuensis]|uniref:VOC domain-containing protein n=1 Tax=Pseudonocardia kongjuensis TaxID=102227 RepID=A0ABP4IRM6_9PSEU